jgi:hypothetical protein
MTTTIDLVTWLIYLAPAPLAGKSSIGRGIAELAGASEQDRTTVRGQDITRASTASWENRHRLGLRGRSGC